MERLRRIMLIEDSPTQAERLRALFESGGYETIHAPSAEEALDRLQSVRPDLIVVDYHLPRMNGDEFCREIRLNVNTRAIPVLMLTVESSDAAHMRGLESGADDYLAKSADPDILLMRVNALLRESGGAAAIVDAEKFLSRARLLAIDDSPTFLHYLVRELGGEGYRVETAAGGQEGLAKAGAGRYDCVLVDVEMSDLDGIEVCRRLAGMRGGSGDGTVLVMLTSDEEKEQMTNGLEAGADDYIPKSSDIALTKARIRALLRRKFSVDENRRILNELKQKEIEAERARAEKEAAEVRATMADKLAEANRELERANSRLKEALDVTRAITDNAADALFMIDREARITFLNPAAGRVFGFGRQELLGRPIHEMLHNRRPDGTPLDAADCPLMRSMHTGETATGHEDVFYRKDGDAVDVACSIAPMQVKGRLTGAVLVLHDVTERNRAEERLRQAQKLESIGLLAGGVAHDFNNLLVGVIGTASFALDLLPPDSDVREHLESIVQTGQQAAHLTRQMLAYSGKGRFVLESLNLSTLIPEIRGLVDPSIPRKISLCFELPPDVPAVEADRGQVQQIFMNLVLNAAEAIGANEGTITVRTGVEQVDEPCAQFQVEAGELRPGKYVVLEVSDTGCGMDEATRSKAFDPFFSTKFVGRGLGLAAVAGIVRGHKGAILVTSEPGKGSTFKVLLPASERVRGALRPRAPKVAVDGRSATILVVDDEKLVRDMVKRALERHGYRVLLAESGMAALDTFRHHAEDISAVILDWSMPQMSGEEILPELRKIRAGIRIVVSSGYGEGEAVAAFKGQPIAGFIQKPYTTAELTATLKGLLG